MEIPAFNSWLKVLPLLNERQRRLYAAQKVLELGHGGLKQVHEWTGLSRPTLVKGLAELRGEVDGVEPERIRRAGGGRKKVETQATPLTAGIERVVAATTPGDPLGPVRWTRQLPRHPAHTFGRPGHQ